MDIGAEQVHNALFEATLSNWDRSGEGDTLVAPTIWWDSAYGQRIPRTAGSMQAAPSYSKVTPDLRHP